MSPPVSPRGVVAVAPGCKVLVEAELSYDGLDTDGLHLWTATFPRAVVDDLLVGNAQLHIDVLPARTTVQVALGVAELEGTP